MAGQIEIKMTHLSEADEAEARAMSWLIRHRVSSIGEIVVDTRYSLGRVVYLIDEGDRLYKAEIKPKKRAKGRR